MKTVLKTYYIAPQESNRNFKMKIRNQTMKRPEKLDYTPRFKTHVFDPVCKFHALESKVFFCSLVYPMKPTYTVGSTMHCTS